jgi:hypothetical protein
VTEPVLEAAITSGINSFIVDASQLDRSENRIMVNDSLAEFLRVAAIDSTTILLKLPGQRSESFRIGTDTVRAWHEIYAPLQPSGAEPAPTVEPSRSKTNDTAKPRRDEHILPSTQQKAPRRSTDDGTNP